MGGLKSQFPEIATSSNDISGEVDADIIFLAVHPPMMMETLVKISGILNPVCFSPSMTVEKRTAVIKLMKPLGTLPEVAEQKIEAYAMIGAMGHTYFWPQIQKLTELAISFGMGESEAQSVVTEMLKGTSATLFNSGLTYTEVVDLVPVKPLIEVESTINGYYDQYLPVLFNKIKP